MRSSDLDLFLYGVSTASIIDNFSTHDNHSSKPATSSLISDNSTGNGKESVPLGSEQSPLSSSNVLAHVIQKVEIAPVSVPLEQGDDRDV